MGIARIRSLIKSATGVNLPTNMPENEIRELWDTIKNLEPIEALATTSVAMAAHTDATGKGGDPAGNNAGDTGDTGDASDGDGDGDGSANAKGNSDSDESPGMGDDDSPEGADEQIQQQVQAAVEQLPEHHHPHMDWLVRTVFSGLPERRVTAMLGGPAGSGKSTAVKILAETLGLRHSAFYCNPRTTLAGLIGRIDAHGNYHPTPFREMWEHGGVMCIDEIDNTAPDFMAGMNGLIDTPIGETGNFPDGDIPRHEDFIIVCTANTWGTGRDRVYVGRSALDGATLNRFALKDWDYDEALEDRLGKVPEWTKFVQAVRAVARDHGFRRIVSPRATIAGGGMLLAGLPWDEVADSALQLTAWTEDEREKLVPVRRKFAAAATKWGS